MCGVVTDVLLGFYARTLKGCASARDSGGSAYPKLQSGSVTVVQRTNSDFRLSPHLHIIALDGAYALVRYVLRPPLAQDRVTLLDDGMVRITLKRAFSDGTTAVDMDPLSLLCRLAASVPGPGFNTVTRSFQIDLRCSRCGGAMKLKAFLTSPASLRRLLSRLGELTEPPSRAPARGPPYFATHVVRRALGVSQWQVETFDAP